MFSFCRLCARCMDTSERKTDISQLETKLSFCCGWKRSQNESEMPQKACMVCVDQLEISWNFAESIWAAEVRLQKLISDPIDAETNEIIFVEDIADVKEEETDPKLISDCVVILEVLKPPVKENAVDECDDNVNEIYNDADDSNTFDEPIVNSDAESVHSNKSEEKKKLKIAAEKNQTLKDAFLSGLTPEDCLDGGLISADGIAKLEKLNPIMKTMSWNDCQYKCGKCDGTFVGSHNFYAHIRSMHTDDLINIKVHCFYCNSKHRREFALNKHIASEHFPHLKYRCMHCSDYYWNTRELNKHRKMHTNVEYKCEQCEQVFFNRDVFYTHATTHHTKKKKAETDEVLVCDICEKTFKTKAGIRNHMLLHMNKFDHMCEICGWKFQSKGNLKGHLASTHSTERPFKCDKCNKWFKTKHQLHNHSVHHLDIRNHECSECGRKFRRPYSLGVHMRSHTHLCPYTCKYCGKSFRHNITLKTHERAHINDKPYPCTICDYRSTAKGNLNKHMMRVHSIDFRNHVMKGRENYTKDGIGYFNQ